MTDWTPDQAERRAMVEAGRTVVANMHKGKDVALLAWAKTNGLLVRIDRKTDWGNPFVEGRYGDRKTVIEKFKAELDLKPSLLRRLPELRGKVLACWCYPQPCHGDHLAERAEAGR